MKFQCVISSSLPNFDFPLLSSPFFQFDRDKKPKGESPGGLEEVLNNLTHSEFTDEQLVRLCGLQWLDFVELTDLGRKNKKEEKKEKGGNM